MLPVHINEKHIRITDEDGADQTQQQDIRYIFFVICHVFFYLGLQIYIFFSIYNKYICENEKNYLHADFYE